MPLKDCQQTAAQPNRLLFESQLVRVGDFTLDPAHPRFSDTGPTQDYCFVFPRTAVWIQHEGSPAFVADCNVVPLYNAGHPFRRGLISVEGDRTDWFGVAPELLREVLRGLDPATAENETRLFRFDFARVMHRTFIRQREVFGHVRGSGHVPDVFYVEESVIGTLHETLATAYQLCPQRRTTPRHRDLTEAAKACLNLTLSEHGGLSDLARSIGASVFHLCRVFRQHTGSTIHRYRNDLRLRRSLELLEEAGDDILAIALTLGYSGHSHFTGTFHKAFGITPSAFRNASRRDRARVRAALDRVEAKPTHRLSVH